MTANSASAVSSQEMLVRLGRPKPIATWPTPKRDSQSNSIIVSPSGRYLFISYLYGIDVVDTEVGKEQFFLMHPKEAEKGHTSDFNIFGYVPLTDHLGYTMERSAPLFGDFWLRRVEFDYEAGTFRMDTDPRVLYSDVKCLTVSWDIRERSELCIIIRQQSNGQEEEAADPADSAAATDADIFRRENRFCCFFGYDAETREWREVRARIPMNKLARIGAWDWFPRLHNGHLYVFPIKTLNNRVELHLEQLGQIAEISPSDGHLQIIQLNNSLKWALSDNVNYEHALFVDNIDYKWVGDNLFLNFVVAFRDPDPAICSYHFENILAAFNIRDLCWRKIELGSLCRGGERVPTPYRMQVTFDHELLLHRTSLTHPCTIYGRRATTHRKRLLWVQPKPSFDAEEEEDETVGAETRTQQANEDEDEGDEDEPTTKKRRKLNGAGDQTWNDATAEERIRRKFDRRSRAPRGYSHVYRVPITIGHPLKLGEICGRFARRIFPALRNKSATEPRSAFECLRDIVNNKNDAGA